MENILLLNTGGTFNKVYNELNGQLEVLHNNKAIENIIKISFRENLNITVKGILYKDSLELTEEDRKIILDEIKDYDKVVIVHGTDTMDLTALYLSKNISNKTVVITGAMKPHSIEPIESTSNLSISLQFLQNDVENDVYIGMHGLVSKHHKIKKNRKTGKFEIRNSSN